MAADKQIRINCEHCSAPLLLPELLKAKQRCPRCGRQSEVPAWAYLTRTGAARLPGF